MKKHIGKSGLKTYWNEAFKQIPIGIRKLSQIVTDLSDTFIIDKNQHDYLKLQNSQK